MGIYFRQKKEYERAAGLLERVLEYKKRKFMEKKISNKDGQSNDDSDEDYMDQFIGKEFTRLYNDLALTYQGMGNLEFAQEYLVLAIQCLEREKLKRENQDGQKQDKADNIFSQQDSVTKTQGLQELADSYLFLADLLRKQANVEQASQAMLKVIQIEQDLPDRLLCLVESYKLLTEDYMILEDYEQGLQSIELAFQIELQIYDMGVRDSNIQETVVFLAEVY